MDWISLAGLIVSILLLVSMWMSGVFNLRDRISKLEGLFEGFISGQNATRRGDP